MTHAALLILVLASSAAADAPAPSPAPTKAPGLICRAGEGPRCDCYVRDADAGKRWRWRACPAPAPTPEPAAPREAPMPVYSDIYRDTPPEPAPSPRPIHGMTVSTTLGGVVTLAGDAGTSVTPTAFVDVDGPLAFGRLELARIYVRLGITSAPGEAVNVTDAQTFRAAEVGLGVYRVLGRLELGDGGQEITTSLAAEWSFASRLSTSDAEPLQRLVRSYGGGLRFDELRSRASLTLFYGRDEAAGPAGYGQWMVSGQVPVWGTDAAVLLVGDATLNVGPAEAQDRLSRFRGAPARRDILRLGVALDPIAMARAMRR